ncbi:MAG: PQQ-binding-like beta-propeller repeat protein [Myxococcales bacterium]|nr:PQQ-binding-like beta-propeller repeat protein [Myxococcales bacterium]
MMATSSPTSPPPPHRALLLALALGLLGSAALTGCGGAPAAFSTRYPDNAHDDIAVLLRRLEAAGNRPAGTVAVGITAEPKKVYAVDMTSGRVLWESPAAATSEPIIAGEAVVFDTASGLVGLDLKSGAPRFTASLEVGKLQGAGGDGPLVAFTDTKGGGTLARSELVLVRGASVAWRREMDAQIGVPTVIGNTVLVPWASQYLSALDAVSGTEIARIRVGDGVIGHALPEGDGVYIGSNHGVAPITASVGSGQIRSGGFFGLPPKDLPGRPQLLRDVYGEAGVQTAESARHRIRLAWQPVQAGAGKVGAQDNTVYLVFYRFVLALDPADYALRWIHVHGTDIVGATGQAGGVAIADAKGGLATLGAASGKVVWQADTGKASTVVHLPRGGGHVEAGQPPSSDELREGLLAAAQDADTRLVPARLWAVDELSKTKDATATLGLIGLCDDTSTAAPVKAQACASLKGREIGADHLLTALGRHAGHLEGTKPPPVAALAKAAASLNEKRAVPLLVTHLADAQTPSRELRGLVESLAKLGDPSAIEPLTRFLQLYHADPIDEHLVGALEVIPGALVDLEATTSIEALRAVASDQLGSEPVRAKAEEALKILEAKKALAEKAAADAAAGKGGDAAAAAEQAAAKKPDPIDKPRPTHLSTEMINSALLPVRKELRACLTKGPKPHFQARVVLVIEDGKVLMVSVVPKELQACVEPLARAQTFPKTRVIKAERVTYTLKRK